ncbi:MAG: hypothetical protein GY950_15505 [bacterium]|nr:hypothetical protein [bacterium]
MSVIEKLFVFMLKVINRLVFRKPRRQVNSRNVMIYSPNIGGHRAIYASKFINYFQKRDFEIFFIYCGLLLRRKAAPGKPRYSEYDSAFLDSFKNVKNVHMVCVRDEFAQDTDEAAFVVELQKKYNIALSVFVDGDVMMRTFSRQVFPGKPRLTGKNYAVFIMIDFIYRNMNLKCLWREPKIRKLLPEFFFHRYYLKYLDLLDGALVSDENLVRKINNPKYLHINDVTHFNAAPIEDEQKKRFFKNIIEKYNRFLARHPGKDVILQFGELENRKGFDFNLRLAAENPDLVLVRAGRTKLTYRITWEDILNKEKLLVEGRLFEVDVFIDSQELIDKLFQSVKYFLFAYQNHFRTSIMLPLALSYSKPVLVPDVGLLHTRVRNRKVGRVFKHLSSESYAEQFAILRKEYNAYHDNIRSYYREEFSQESFEKFLDDYFKD